MSSAVACDRHEDYLTCYEIMAEARGCGGKKAKVGAKAGGGKEAAAIAPLEPPAESAPNLRMQQVEVVVPEGLKGGQLFKVETPGGVMEVCCPTLCQLLPLPSPRLTCGASPSTCRQTHPDPICHRLVTTTRVRVGLLPD